MIDCEKFSNSVHGIPILSYSATPKEKEVYISCLYVNVFLTYTIRTPLTPQFSMTALSHSFYHFVNFFKLKEYYLRRML